MVKIGLTIRSMSDLIDKLKSEGKPMDAIVDHFSVEIRIRISNFKKSKKK